MLKLFNMWVKGVLVATGLTISVCSGYYVYQLLFSSGSSDNDSRLIQETVTTDERPAIVDAIKQSSQLITTRFYGNTVVPIEKSSTLWGFIPAGKSSLLYVASGSVLFGVDLYSLDSEAVEIIGDGDERILTITLPPVVILEASLDLSKSTTYQAESNLINPTDTVLDLAEQAQDKALHQLVYTACQSVGANADVQAKTAIAKLLQSLGYHNVKVIIQNSTDTENASSISTNLPANLSTNSGDFQTCHSIQSSQPSNPPSDQSTTTSQNQ